jgi:predicted DNA-binding transcriptional regulator YafY
MASKRFGKPRASGEPSGATERKIRILLELIRNKFVRLGRLCDEYGTSERSLLRDMQELRKIGARAGFRLSEKAENDTIRLLFFEARPSALDKSGRALRGLIRSAARALGKPVEQELEAIASEEPREDRRFLHFLLPALREGSRVAETFKQLEDAWTNSARVTFNYSGKERRVEPYYVYVRSGRYYLLARDGAGNAWKYYALDHIEPPVKRAGSFTPRETPAQYRNDDVIGWFKGKSEERVSVRISPQIALSAVSRQWQREQRVQMHEDGSATMTFTVSDLDEVIRWSLGFGAEARIVAPQSAVERARATAYAICEQYER